MTTTTNDAHLTKALDREFQRNLGRVAQELRYLADQVAGVGVSTGGGHAYSDAGAEVLRLVTNTLPNLPLGNLVRAAADADSQAALDAFATELREAKG